MGSTSRLRPRLQFKLPEVIRTAGSISEAIVNHRANSLLGGNNGLRRIRLALLFLSVPKSHGYDSNVVWRFGLKFVNALISILCGLALGIFLHYLLYRFAIPGKPFIYVAF